jgi:ligand-binding sensor domain-containing protein
LWAVGVTPGGAVSHFDGQRWTHHAKPPDWPCWPRDVAADVGGGLWLTSPACELQGFDGQNWAPYPIDADLRARAAFRGALLARAPDGALYLGAQDQILRYAEGEWQPLPLPAPSDAVRFTVSALVADEQGGLWVGGWSAPYLRYFDGARWRDFGEAVDAPVHSLTLDGAGRLWVGTEGGLMGYDGATWQRVESGDMLVALAQGPAGRVWASGPHGLYVYTPD